MTSFFVFLASSPWACPACPGCCTQPKSTRSRSALMLPFLSCHGDELHLQLHELPRHRQPRVSILGSSEPSFVRPPSPSRTCLYPETARTLGRGHIGSAVPKTAPVVLGLPEEADQAPAPAGSTHAITHACLKHHTDQMAISRSELPGLATRSQGSLRRGRCRGIKARM